MLLSIVIVIAATVGGLFSLWMTTSDSLMFRDTTRHFREQFQSARPWFNSKFSKPLKQKANIIPAADSQMGRRYISPQQWAEFMLESETAIHASTITNILSSSVSEDFGGRSTIPYWSRALQKEEKSRVPERRHEVQRQGFSRQGEVQRRAEPASSFL